MLNFFRPKRFIRSFEYHRHIVKTLVFHKTFEEIQADKPLADTVVTVYTATQRFFRIVQVYGAQKTEANGLIEFV